MSHRIIALFWLLFCCSFLLTSAATQVDAHEKNKAPCQIDVIFQDDQAGVATYFVLRFQHKNQSGRSIEAVSVLVRDSADKIIRNSDAICGDGNEGIDAGDTGQCENVLQIITGKMSNKVGYDAWVKMIEDQRQQIGVANRCEVLGVRYKK